MMKRLFTALAASLLLLTACGGESSEIKAVIPGNDSIKSSLEARDYKVTVLGDLEKDGFVSLSAHKNGSSLEDFDGLFVLYTKNADDLEKKETETAAQESENVITYSKINDPELGNVYVSGTKTALNAAGIKIDSGE